MNSYNCKYCQTERQHKTQCTDDFLRCKAREEAQREYDENFNECDGIGAHQVGAQLRDLYYKWCRKLGVRAH